MKPILFTIGPIAVFGYGVMITLGGLLGFWFLHSRLKIAGLRGEDDFWILVNVMLLGGFAGGRLLYLFQLTQPLSAAFWRALISPSSGFSVFGAFATVPLAVYGFCRVRGIPFWRLFDVISVMAPLWHGFGRIGCFLAGCCHGRPTDLPWGIVFRDPQSQIPANWLGIPLHPTQLYEAFANWIAAFFLWRLFLRTEKRPPALVTACYFGAYGIIRFVEEFFRGDTSPAGFGLTQGQALGLGLLAAAAAIAVWRKRCFRPS